MSENLTPYRRKRGFLMGPFEVDIFLSEQRKRSLIKMGGKMEERRRNMGSREEQRRAAKLHLLNICETVGVANGKRKALGLFSLRTGHTVERAEIYLNELADAGLIEVQGNTIISESVESRKKLEEIKNEKTTRSMEKK